MIDQTGFHFGEISPDLILDALMEVGLYLDSGLTELNSYENRVYQFMDENKRRYVVKFYRPERWSRSQIQEEHDFTFELQEAGLCVATPILFSGQSILEFGGYLFAIFPSIGGRQYETDNLFQLEEVGRLLGRVHQIGKTKLFSFRPEISIDEYLTAPLQTLATSPLVTAKLREPLLDVLNKLTQEVKSQWPTDYSKLRLHGDCHPGNILWRDEAWLVDFDDSRNGPAIQDLWMLLNGDRREQRIQLDTLLEAYNEFCDFDIKELRLIEPLRAMRMVHYLAWIAKRWQDPAFPKAFPWMNESDFWHRQVKEFTQQIVLLQEPPLQLNPFY